MVADDDVACTWTWRIKQLRPTPKTRNRIATAPQHRISLRKLPSAVSFRRPNSISAVTGKATEYRTIRGNLDANVDV